MKEGKACKGRSAHDLQTIPSSSWNGCDFACIHKGYGLFAPFSKGKVRRLMRGPQTVLPPSDGIAVRYETNQ